VLARDADGDGHPTWSPDGKRIAFVRGLPAQHVAIYVMRSDGGGQKRLTDARVGSFDPAWSPDGSKIAFTSERDEDNEVYIMSPDGSGQRRLTHGGGDSASWSPDGTKIAFARYRGDASGIYVINADGTGETALTGHAAGDFDPAWKPLARRP
jgi:TolB protein